jgi:hypothetical protein
MDTEQKAVSTIVSELVDIKFELSRYVDDELIELNERFDKAITQLMEVTKTAVLVDRDKVTNPEIVSFGEGDAGHEPCDEANREWSGISRSAPRPVIERYARCIRTVRANRIRR